MSDKLHILDEPEPAPKKTASTTSKPKKYHWRALELMFSSTCFVIPLVLYAMPYIGYQTTEVVILFWWLVVVGIPFGISWFPMKIQISEIQPEKTSKQAWQLVWKRFYAIQKGIFLIILSSFLVLLCLSYWKTS